MAKDKKVTKAQTEAADHHAAAAPPAAEHAKDVEIREGPVLTVIQKRLRAANKKLRRCEELETSRAAGKPMNAEQASPLRQPHLPACMTHTGRSEPGGPLGCSRPSPGPCPSSSTTLDTEPTVPPVSKQP